MSNLGYNAQMLDLLTGQPVYPHQLDAADRAEFVRQVFAAGNFSADNIGRGWSNFQGLPRYYALPFGDASGGKLSPKEPNQKREPEWLLIVGCGSAAKGGMVQFCIGPVGQIWIGESETARYGYKPQGFEYYRLDREAKPLADLMESVGLFTGTLKGLGKVAAHQLHRAQHELADCQQAATSVDTFIGRVRLS